MGMRLQRRATHFAVRCDCSYGHTHASAGEANYCDILHLRMQEKGSEITRIEKEKRYPYIIAGVKVCDHLPDWTVTYKDGRTEVVEYKGRPEDVWVLKKKIFEALYPGIPYTVVTGAGKIKRKKMLKGKKMRVFK